MAIVDSMTVAKYYVECELGNVVDCEDATYKEGLYASNLLRILEALSFTYRANDMFDYVANDRYKWELREVPIDSITLTGVGETLTKIVYSDEVQQNVSKFVDYIKSHPDNPIFDEFRHESAVPARMRTLIMRDTGGVLKMLDGSHRLIAMAMAGETTVPAYVAVPADNAALPRVGDAVFLRLRKVWQQTTSDVLKSSIEQTVAGMINETADGRQAVQSYWINMGPNENVRVAGARIIERSTTD